MSRPQIVHAHTPKCAHSAEVQEVGNRRPSNWCGVCNDWFKPVPPKPFGTGCDGAGPHVPGEIRKLPVVVGNPHLGNMLLCRSCFDREIAFRVERNKELAKGCEFDLPEWASLEVYP